MKITNPTKPFASGEKRFYMPGMAIETKCVACGKTVKKEFDRDYLMYPMFNEPIEVTIYCGIDDCDGETEVSILLRLTVEPA